MKTLVTGGGGFLGRYIVEQLLARGDSVRVFSRGDYPELTSMGVDLVRGDVRSSHEVQQACREIDVVFHTAAIPGIWGPWEMYHGINTVGTQNVIEGCLKNHVKKLVFTSSPSVVFDGQPHENADESLPYPESYLCHYPHSKALAEKAVLAANGENGLATCALRPHLIWGPRDNHLIPRLFEKAQAGRLRIVGDGENLISVSYVENSAAAHLQAEEKLEIGSDVAGQAYFINEPEPVAMWSWINELLGMAGIPPLKKRISARTAKNIGHILETVFGCLRLASEPPMTRFVASQLSESHYYDVSKARQHFDFRPSVSLHDGMQRLRKSLTETA